MRRFNLSQEALMIGVALTFLIFGLASIWAVKYMLNISADSVFIALLLIPIVLYLAYSGRLSAIKGAGVEVNFAAAAQQLVQRNQEAEPVTVEVPQTIDKGSVNALDHKLQSIDQSKFIVLTVKMGRGGVPHHYNLNDLRDHVEKLSQYRHFKLMVILDTNGRFVAHMRAESVRQILQSYRGQQFVEDLNQGREGDLKNYPGAQTEIATVFTTDTNLDALKKMVSLNLEVLVVLDKDRKVQGVVGRELVLGKLIVAMANPVS